MARDVYIISAVRTPMGSFMGGMKDVPAPMLGAAAIKGAVERVKLDPGQVDEVLMGCVLQAGLGQAPARQAALGAGIPTEKGTATINKVCGSGMKAVTMACQAIIAGDAEVVAAGGMESMSRAPYLLEKARGGYRMGNAELVDSMMRDGLVDAHGGISMGVCGEMVADKYRILRDEQDEYAIASFTRARAAWEAGDFSDEVVPVDGVGVPAKDECPARFDPDKMRRLKAAFKSDGSITAGNSSAIADGAAALVLASADFCRNNPALRPMAKVVAFAQVGVEPLWFGIAPAMAAKKALKHSGLSAGDIGLFEINEAFAAVAIAAIREMDLDAARVNVNGGAVALGHPIGATGARLIVTLVHALHSRAERFGLAALCMGGGEGMAMIVEGIPWK